MASAFSVLLNCMKLSFYVYGFYIHASEFFNYTIPVIVFLTAVFFGLVHYFSISKPDQLVVDEILGRDPKLISEGGGEDTYTMKVVAHRGAGFDAPENSMSAFKLARERGCTAVEFDITLTADGVAVLFHDDTTERVTGQSGYIREMTWDEARELNVAATHPFSDKFKFEGIPTFEEAIVDCIQNDIRMFIDIKLDDLKLSSLSTKDNKLVQVILDAYARHPQLYKRAVVSSFNPVIIYLIRRANPGIVCSLAYRPQFFTYESYTGAMGGARPRYGNLLKHLAAQMLDSTHGWLLEHLWPCLLGLSAILLHKDLASPDSVAAWQSRGLRVILWTVNMPLEKKFASSALKVTYMTDTLLGTADELKAGPTTAPIAS